MNAKQIKYVLTLSEKLNFTLAAEELGITQPSLSQYIKKAEKEIGTDLFIRNGQDIRLTDAGRVYIKAGKRLLDIEHRLHSDLQDIAKYKKGSLIVGSSPYRSAGMLPEAVRKLRDLYPGVQVIVAEHTTAELMEGLEHGAYDLCISVLPVNERLFSWEKIVEEELILTVPASFRQLKSETVAGRKYPSIDARDLNGQAFVGITESQVMQRELNNLCLDYHIELNKVAVVKSLGAQIAMVRAGVGMALLPAGIERFCGPGEVSYYSFQQKLLCREVVAVWPKDRPLTQTARALVDCIKEIAW